ncbi:MAG: hypothetical protein Q7S93_13220 [Phenylobacterium sp.]|uniref:hypothetical protein n=1 Tax=Phenylobacterium sp. TaxID=1871053 RepID=UPI00271D3985|nr:hypothetical protein [Phenylobacterium sp.]MDO8411008.1 hypothetical protein [Phenylobacterium sp.]
MKRTVLLVLCLAGCGSPEPAAPPKPAPPEKVTFDGVTFPGGPADAKASGLIHCDGSMSGFTCEKTSQAALLGVPALKAAAWLKPPERFQVTAQNLDPPKPTPDDLRYDDVSFYFEETRHKYPCEADTPGDPTACVENPERGIPAVERKLIDDGWKFSEWRSYRTYVKLGIPMEITVGGIGGDRDSISLRRMELAEVAEKHQGILTKEAEQQQKVGQEKAFIEQMAK